MTEGGMNKKKGEAQAQKKSAVGRSLAQRKSEVQAGTGTDGV